MMFAVSARYAPTGNYSIRHTASYRGGLHIQRILKSTFKAVIFDMDGTLVDTENLILDLWVSTALEMGYVLSRDIISKTVGTTYGDTIRFVQEAYPGAPHDEIRKETSRKFQALREQGLIGLCPNVPGALETVASAGLPIGLCTSTRSSSARHTLESTGIMKYFDAMVFGDEITHGKPDPEPYLTVASKLGIEPGACFAVEDSPSGARSALAAGMTVAVVPGVLAVPDDIARMATVHGDIMSAIGQLFD